MANTELLIGVDLGGTNMRVGAVTEDGKVFHRLKLPTNVELGLQEVVEKLIKTIRQVIQEAVSNGDRIIGIGIGSPGIIDIKSGIIVSSPNFPQWKQVPLKQIIEERISIPTFLDNDANAFALGEKWLGAGKGVQSLVCLTLGTGVGGGIILGGHLWHGVNGMAAEIGHMTVVPDGLPCNCGNSGCLEMYASASSIVRRIVIALQAGESSAVTDYVNNDLTKITSDLVYHFALKGDSLAGKIMHETSIYLGIGIANLINLLNPEMILIGGGLTNAWDLIYPDMIQEVHKRAFEVPAKRVKIVRASLNDNAGIIGAAGIAHLNLKKLSKYIPS